MKYKVLLSALFTILSINVSATDVEINETNFPDEIFRVFLKAQPYGEDGIITTDEIEFITDMVIPSSGNIATLKGIEYFTSLKYLMCNGHKLTSLDMSKNLSLEKLICAANKLTSLNLPNTDRLYRLICDDNKLTSLDVSSTPNLEYLDCQRNLLTSLDLSSIWDLSYLNCQYNE